MNSRYAAIDLGTNTFHLLIGGAKNSGYKEVLRRVDPVRLGERINDGVITQEAFNRGLSMLKEYAAVCAAYKVTTIHAVGTSALRNAKNGKEFSRRVLEETGIPVITISGEEEAAYIYKGVRLSGCLDNVPSLILDIGGGSVELILCNKETIYWKQSFEMGAARLTGLFHTADPMPEASFQSLMHHLGEKLAPLFLIALKFPVSHLIGSAGAFETFAEMLAKGFDPAKQINFSFERQRLLDILSWLASSSHQERVGNKRIIPLRIDMIVSAAIITRFVIEKLGIQRISMTAYSLKEGIMEELFPKEWPPSLPHF